MDLFQNRLLTFVVLLTAQVVLGERSIVTNPSNATTTRGETVIFRCTVTPATDGSYVVWMQKGIQISSNYDVRTSRVDPQRYSVISESIGEEYNLQITNTNSLDSGSYWCVVKSDSTSVLATSTTAWLRYKTPPSVEYPECLSEEVYQEGDQVAFTCRSGVAVPPVALAWEDENRVALDAEQRSEGIFEITELTRTLTRADNGKTFRCNLTHELVEGERFCSVGPLNVEYPPTEIEIENTSSDGILYVGGSISLECKADANPPADFEWMVPSDITERKVQKNGKLLSVFDVQSGFDGLSVECVASNELGETKTSSVLTVTVPTTTTEEMRRTTIPATETQQTTSRMPAEVPKVPTEYPRRPTPEVKHNTPMPTGGALDKILGVERNFLVALIIGALFILICFILLLFLVFGKKRGRTIVFVNSEDNLEKLSGSEASVSGTKVLLGTPVMDRRNRNVSENPSDDLSIDSAIHLISPTNGDQPDYRGQMVHRSRSNLSAVSSQSSGPSFIRVPSTELLISPNSQQRVEQPRYLVVDMVGQNGKPFPSAEQARVPVTYATTGRQGGQNSGRSSPSTNPRGSPQPYATTGRQVPRQQGSNPIFESIPMRSVSQDPQRQSLYVRQGDQFVPVQQVGSPSTPEGYTPVIMTVGDGSDSSQEEINAQERLPFLNPRYRPV